MSQAKLIIEVFRHSTDEDWNFFKKEWKLINVQSATKYSNCLCGNGPIINICSLYNEYTDNKIVVGECCIHHFLSDDKDIKNIQLVIIDGSKSLNFSLIEKALSDSIINQWEYDFYKDILKKRKLSIKQSSKKQHINNKIIKDLI